MLDWAHELASQHDPINAPRNQHMPRVKSITGKSADIIDSGVVWPSCLMGPALIGHL